MRLEPAAVTASVVSAVPDPEPQPRRAERVRREQSPSVERAGAGAATPQVPDPTYYAAHELDSYPRLAGSLDLDQFFSGVARGATARLRLALLIDERGVVNDITAVETGLPSGLEEDLHARLAATAFIPARKDGRAVKSRILLEVNLGLPSPAGKAGQSQ